MLSARLKISTRIYAGFGCLMLLALVIAVMGSTGIGSLGRQTMAMKHLAANMEYVLTASNGLERVGRLAAGARSGGSAGTADAYHAALAKARAQLAVARANSLSPQRIVLDDAVLGKMDALDASGTRLFDTGTTYLAARTKLFQGGDDLTAASGHLVDAATQNPSAEVSRATDALNAAVLLVRVANWRFLATADAKGIDTFHTNAALAHQRLDAVAKLDAPELRALIPPVAATLNAYALAFDSAAPALLELGQQYDGTLRPLLAGMQDQLGQAESSLDTDFAAAVAESGRVQGSVSFWQDIVAGACLLFGLVLAVITGRAIVRPVRAITAVMAVMAGGNNRVTIPATDRGDEIGEMARALSVFRDGLQKAEELAAEQEVARAARARRQDSMDHHTQTFGASVTTVMTSLADAARNMSGAADTMAKAAGSVHAQASETAVGAGSSSADLAGVAAAVEQFSASVAEISRQVEMAAAVSREAMQRAEASQTSVRNLSDSTARISDVVRLIDAIAAQTNLLALNATIEAARAGDAGKGFAVVANEVKALASQTTKATAEIGAQIGTVRDATESTIAAMNEIGGIIGKMGEVSSAISAAVEEQSVTTRSIAASVQSVAGSTARAAGAMETVVAVATTAGDASQNILNVAGEIGTQADKLMAQVENFLIAVREDAGERRRSERLAGQGVTASLRLPGAPAAEVVIKDISKSGIAVRHRGAAKTGQQVEIMLPDASRPVTAEVVRADGEFIALTFHETTESRLVIERVLESLSQSRLAA